MTTAGYCAIAISAGAFTRLSGPGPLAAGLLVLASIEAILAISALAFHAQPDAQFIGSTWRASGTFQYPPALGVLELGALPIATDAMRRTTGLMSSASAASAVLAGSAILLTESRLALVLALIFLATLIVATPSGPSKSTTIMAVALILGGAVLTRTAAAAHISSAASDGRWGLLVQIAVIVSGCAMAWALYRFNPQWNRFAVVATACLAATLALTHLSETQSASAQHSSPRPTLTSRSAPDLLHGRSREWRAAVQTWFRRPVLGYGAGSYYAASLAVQGESPVLYAHELTLESAAELGTPGLLLALALYLSCALTVAASRARRTLTLLAPMAIAFLISNAFDWTWHLTGLSAVWALALGGLAQTARDTSAKAQVGKTNTLGVWPIIHSPRRMYP